jgi:uncharacterized protein with NRDE domain
MCLIVFAYENHQRYRLVLAANRDEYYDRPTEAAAFWPENTDVLAGRDLVKMGTWFGVTKTGRFAAITNYRDPANHKSKANSRGEVVADFLQTDLSPDRYLKALTKKSRLYNGFNLLAGDCSSLCYYSNRRNGITQIVPGLFGLSNHLLDTPWPKVTRARDKLKLWLKEDIIDKESLFELLADNTRADDKDLPDTGMGLEWERILSPAFIKSAVYGTRSSTVLLIDRQNRVLFTERTFDPAGEGRQEVSFEFIIDA